MKTILFVQHGDFRDAYARFSNGEAETYRDQRKSVGFVTSLAEDSKVVNVILGSEQYNAELSENLWSLGVNKNSLDDKSIAKIFDDLNPTHIVLRTPHLGFLTEANRRNCFILPCFADMFEKKGLRSRLSNFRIARALKRSKAPCVSNHSLNASRSLVSALKISPDRVVPWDWSKVPIAEPAKTGPSDPLNPRAFFAGAVTEAKGVKDCLDAVTKLASLGINMTLTIAGGGHELSKWQEYSKTQGIADQVNFLGTVPNSSVREEMRSHDFVLVPSRHNYAEGLPNVIYEALASRSVLIMSDHPAFRGRLEPDRECLVFPAENSDALAHCIKTAAENTELYEMLSKNAEHAHDSLYIGLEWSDLIRRFLTDPTNSSGWAKKNSLKASGF